MANIKSQIKRNRQNEARRQRNKAVRSELKTYVRHFHQAVESGDATAATEAMRKANRELDKAAGKGVIHKNQAANRKSALSRQAAELSAS
ncbi:MAG: 30S ribosomal protein S20 [Actinobacteria bacterium]|nr:30S ribosomal protein S20 [Actinomycetota bacterium]